MKVLALIPARGGSKGIPRKNIKKLGELPLVAYSILSSTQAKKINRTVVSTDDEEIASISRAYGAETPFIRPKKYALDNTLDLPVFVHALKWFKKNENYFPDIVVHLRPTSPFRKVGHIDESIEKLIKNPQADSVRTVIEPFENPYKMWSSKEDGYLKPLIQSSLKEAYNMPRQKLPKSYWQTGYVDVSWSNTILKKKSMTGSKILPLITDQQDWVDLDTLSDWQRAEQLLDSGEIRLEKLGLKVDSK